MDESYSKWNLILFKPWKQRFEKVKDGYSSYANALWDFVYDDNFPASKRFHILRAKRKEKPLDLSSTHYFGGEQINTPTDDAQQHNDDLQQAADASTSPMTNDD